MNTLQRNIFGPNLAILSENVERKRKAALQNMDILYSVEKHPIVLKDVYMTSFSNANCNEKRQSVLQYKWSVEYRFITIEKWVMTHH